MFETLFSMLAAATDPTPIVDGVTEVITAAGYGALIPIAQIAASLLLKVPFIKRDHPTTLNRALAWFARWPGPRS